MDIGNAWKCREHFWPCCRRSQPRSHLILYIFDWGFLVASPFLDKNLLTCLIASFKYFSGIGFIRLDWYLAIELISLPNWCLLLAAGRCVNTSAGRCKYNPCKLDGGILATNALSRIYTWLFISSIWLQVMWLPSDQTRFWTEIV